MHTAAQRTADNKTGFVILSDPDNNVIISLAVTIIDGGFLVTVVSSTTGAFDGHAANIGNIIEVRAELEHAMRDFYEEADVQEADIPNRSGEYVQELLDNYF